MIHRLRKECPGKRFIPVPIEHCRCNECKFMKMNTLEKVSDCMKRLAHRAHAGNFLPALAIMKIVLVKCGRIV